MPPGGMAAGAGAGAAGAGRNLGAGAQSGGGSSGKAMNLQSMQMLDRRAANDNGMLEAANDNGQSGYGETMGGDTELSDESLGGSDNRSVLDAGAKRRSYTEGQAETVEDPMAGGGILPSHIEELEGARQRERRLREIQEQFTTNVNEVQARKERTQFFKEISGLSEPSQKQPTERPEEDSGEQQMAENLQRQQQRSALSRAKEQLKERAKDRLKQQLEKRLAKRASSGAIRGTIEGTELATSETIVPLIILILELNIQMINKYIFTPAFFKGWNDEADEALEGAPFFDQSFIEDILTVWIDFQLTCGSVCTNPVCMPFTCLIVIIGGISGVVAGVVSNAK